MSARIRKLCIQSKRSRHVLGSFGITFQSRKERCPIEERLREIGIMRSRLSKCRKRILRSPQCLKDASAPVPRDRVFRVKHENELDRFERLVMTSKRRQRHGAGHLRFRKIGPLREGAVEAGKCISGAVNLLQHQSAREECFDGCGMETERLGQQAIGFGETGRLKIQVPKRKQCRKVTGIKAQDVRVEPCGLAKISFPMGAYCILKD